jgi:hypothetical protein
LNDSRIFHNSYYWLYKILRDVTNWETLSNVLILTLISVFDHDNRMDLREIIGETVVFIKVAQGGFHWLAAVGNQI